ncbi:GNAT family N-acetyltransferase [Pseudomonas sp.]|uniref:GNAT family N-acetyltransferase n=1 Tax=Pseudomonas sp. TaxID=306 RepID=UPI0028ADC3D0|nr:GNAT family N-acetyltransferase [Pseudomonas sp.]
MYPSTPQLTTPRLLLKPLQLGDAAAIQLHFGQWEVVRYLNARVPWPYPDDGALRFVQDVCLPAVARGEQWHWTIRLLSDPEAVIGSISLMLEPDNNRGFWLAPAWQGQGYMSEACAVVDTFWFVDLQQPVMRVPKAASNTGSRKLSERAGMRVIRRGESDYVSGRLPEELWEISGEEWRRRQAPTLAITD